MRRAAPAVVLLLCLLAGCGVPSDAAPRALDPANAPFRFYEQPQQSVVEGPGQVALYFVRGDFVVLSRRSVEQSTSIEEAMDLLLDGPTPEEIEAGTRTALPPGLSVENVTVGRNGVAVVTLGGGTQIGTSPLAFAQIVATLTAPGRATAVRFRLDGEDVPALRGNGSTTNDPVDRRDYDELLKLESGAPETATPSPSPSP